MGMLELAVVGFHRELDDCKQCLQVVVVADKGCNGYYPSYPMAMPDKGPCHLQQI